MNASSTILAQCERAIDALYGPLPPERVPLQVSLMHELQRPSHRLSSWRVNVGTGGVLGWTVSVAWPDSAHSCPVLISPDGCWPHVLGEPAIECVLNEGVALAWFNRTELAFDRPDGQRQGPVHQVWPETPWSAIAVWAWGIGRCVDALQTALGPRIVRWGVIGHSRGGKAALVAAARDTRLQAVISHNSGTGGAASLQMVAPEAESLNQLAQRFPHWLAPHALSPQAQQQIIADDAAQHWLRAIAPRGLCIVQAHDDLWANPPGTRHMVERLRPGWQTCPDRLQWHGRTGGHAMGRADWLCAARFLQQIGTHDQHAAPVRMGPSA